MLAMQYPLSFAPISCPLSRSSERSTQSALRLPFAEPLPLQRVRLIPRVLFVQHSPLLRIRWQVCRFVAVAVTPLTGQGVVVFPWRVDIIAGVVVGVVVAVAVAVELSHFLGAVDNVEPLLSGLGGGHGVGGGFGFRVGVFEDKVLVSLWSMLVLVRQCCTVEYSRC